MKYICTYCNVYAYDEEKGDPNSKLQPGTIIDDIPDSWLCPVCGMPKDYLQEVRDEIFSLKMTAYTETQHETQDLNYYRSIARKMLTGICGEYPVCDGQPDRICVGQKFGASIGFGGAGQGKTFEANYNSLQGYKLKMRVIKAHHEPEMSISIFGKKIGLPVMGASLSGVKTSMNDVVPEAALYRGLLKGAMSSGTVGLVGNTPNCPDDLGINIVGENMGWGIPIFKPQSQKRLIQLIKMAEELDVTAVGVDLEGAGSTFWATSRKQVFRKSETEIQELVECTEKPVIFKGIMSKEDAIKVLDSGAGACYVSNHGGRVLDGGQGMAEVLPDIAKVISGKIPIMADGAVRTGFDVLKILALGADVALIGRPLARLSIAGGEVAVKMYFKYVKEDLRRAMILTGCDKLTDATMDILIDPVTHK
ncbi:MAG TPA: alpha-hydroxy-acid oxidizing protein [Methanobacterium sp.]|nr:alpha-hydroxy-acid oxidizing protein [Methanobacterium sp.]